MQNPYDVIILEVFKKIISLLGDSSANRIRALKESKPDALIVFFKTLQSLQLDLDSLSDTIETLSKERNAQGYRDIFMPAISEIFERFVRLGRQMEALADNLLILNDEIYFLHESYIELDRNNMREFTRFGKLLESENNDEIWEQLQPRLDQVGEAGELLRLRLKNFIKENYNWKDLNK